ncbi:MnhB domain-containing protein [Microtetraspora niveoalba]|uniref:MnhB domain-containing protein n=1 Tax=Microtetraspora niveoalba TaxID=46175 RepID=UPI00082B8F1B|nr:MnhB domain-containing protein [Microtetraspora niveoalba]
MSGRARLVVFVLGAAGLAVAFVFALGGMPPFGGSEHPYRDLAVAAALRHVTPNVVSSVNFDQRALDTLGEETILLGSVIGAAALLRLVGHEKERPERAGGRLPDAIGLGCYLLLPVTLLIGLDVVAHGHLTPGGGFQGGVVLATGLHLLYLAGRYRSLERLRPLAWYEFGEGASATAFVGVGLAGLAAGGSFLANVLPLGSFRELLSAGTVPVLNIVVGCAVATGAVVLLAQFLEQAIRITGGAGPGSSG